MGNFRARSPSVSKSLSLMVSRACALATEAFDFVSALLGEFPCSSSPARRLALLIASQSQSSRSALVTLGRAFTFIRPTSRFLFAIRQTAPVYLVGTTRVAFSL